MVFERMKCRALFSSSMSRNSLLSEARKEGRAPYCRNIFYFYLESVFRYSTSAFRSPSSSFWGGMPMAKFL